MFNNSYLYSNERYIQKHFPVIKVIRALQGYQQLVNKRETLHIDGS